MCSLKVSWSSKITPRFLTEVDGVIVDEPNWIVKSCCRFGVAGKTRSSGPLPGWAVGDVYPCWDVCQAAWDLCSYRWIIWFKREIELCVMSIAMVGEAMCLYEGNRWCSVCEEEEGSKIRSLGNPSDQLMCFGYLPSPGHPERLTSEIGFKPAKWNPSDDTVGRRIWWLTVSKVADRSSRMRTDDLELYSVTESSVVPVESPLLKSDCLASSLLVCERNNENWLKITCLSVFAMNGRRETGL